MMDKREKYEEKEKMKERLETIITHHMKEGEENKSEDDK